MDRYETDNFIDFPQINILNFVIFIKIFTSNFLVTYFDFENYIFFNGEASLKLGFLVSKFYLPFTKKDLFFCRLE